jgi:hypothetical protein
MWWLDPSGSGPGAEDIRDGHFPTLHRLEGPEDVKLHHHLVPGDSARVRATSRSSSSGPMPARLAAAT